MPSFDVVSKTDHHEVMNAVDQSNRELSTRFDFKGTDARLELNKNTITLIAPSDFQLKQIDEILRNKLAKRQIDVRSLAYKNPEINLSEAKQEIEVKQGINAETAKKIVKSIIGAVPLGIMAGYFAGIDFGIFIVIFSTVVLFISHYEKNPPS